MLYALLCYNSEEVVGSWSKEEDDAVMAKLARVNERLMREKKMGPVARLMPTTAATTLRKSGKNRRLETGDEPPLLLEDQDRARWNRGGIAEGLALLEKAMRHRRPGPYQVQAAIAALHDRATRPEDTDWNEIDALYAALERLTPSPVVTLNRAVAVAKLRGPEAALALIEPLAPQLGGYFYFFGLRGALLTELGRTGEAGAAFRQALALAHTATEAAHIRKHLDRLGK